MLSPQVAFMSDTRHSKSTQPTVLHMMSDQPSSPYNLVPEVALLSSLPEHLQQRFARALEIMHHDYSEGLTWEAVAEQSAISPFHFHRQFSQLFHETPGQYLSRIRLQVAVSLLLDAPSKTITEIALEAGFSSSQALAKALRRQLGTTAKVVRHLAHAGTPAQTTELLARLAHPSTEQAIEFQLADNLPCALIRFPERYVKPRPIPDFEWERMCEKLGHKVTRLVCLAPVAELDQPWHAIPYHVGEWVSQAARGNCTVKAGNYLCCEVSIASDIGYLTAQAGLFDYAEKHNLPIDLEGYHIEMIREVELTATGSATFAMQIPILTKA
ncbi:helix-turn-helix transcriptional regulator [Photobacterium sp. TY1-4]|uniref:helix-turn-helix transcriptional regulator n=1 Tax=Photobacterium sp. TY1-4 TaxID=2899122 RepID=UPI0021BF4BD4|nr:AraC family transcriptional regulator [Photobacterium sp. TY1-4]UXI03581.1 AraC family transcriptional regulator [Photobacterium sp. TY1-4]